MRRAALIILLAAVYAGCAKQPLELPDVPPETPEPPRAVAGGTVRVALSSLERGALAHHALVGAEGLPALFTADRIDRWTRLAPQTLLDHVAFVSDQRIPPVELFLLGEIDITPAYGRDLQRLDVDSDQARLLRAEGWDRTYLLRCDPGKRWTRDPNFRRWLAETVERSDLLAALFDGRGAPAWTVQNRASGPVWSPPVRRPFGSSSKPVLHLEHEAHDPRALSIASRMKARFAAEGVELRLVAQGDVEQPELILDVHQRWSADPLAALTPWISHAGEAGAGAAHYMEQGRAASATLRGNLAALAEDALLVDALIVPLVRLEAWIAVAPELQDVSPGLTGDLGLGQVWWQR